MFGLVVAAASEKTFVSIMPELNQVTGLVTETDDIKAGMEYLLQALQLRRKFMLAYLVKRIDFLLDKKENIYSTRFHEFISYLRHL